MSTTVPDEPAQSADREAKSGAFDSLSFLDLIYAIPVGDVAVRVSNAQVSRVPAGSWASVALCLTVTVLSWIGLHQNRALMRSGQVSRVSISATEFFSPRFVQFMLEIGIIGLYFMMGLHLELPQKTGPVPPPDLSWLLASLLLVFAAYLVWDLLDILIACMPPDENNNKNWSYSAFAKSATIGAVVTLAVTIATAVCYAIVRSAHPAGQRAVLVWCLALIAVAYGYRVAQEKAKKRWG